MGLIARDSGSNREPAPAGTHAAWCFGMIDLGTQTGQYEGRQRSTHKVWIWWELAEERQADGKPFRLGGFYSVSLHEKSSLRKMLQSWRGVPFTAEELDAFDLTTIVGKPCLVNVAHNKTPDGKVRDQIAAVTKLVKGMTIPPMAAQKTIFNIDEWDARIFDSLPDFLKSAIAKSPEGKAKLGLGGRQPGDDFDHDSGYGHDEADEQIPF